MSTLKSWNELTIGDRFLPTRDGHVMTVLRPVSETPRTRTLLVGSAFSSLDRRARDSPFDARQRTRSI